MYEVSFTTMYEVSFTIESKKIRAQLFSSGKVASFDNRQFRKYKEIVKIYCEKNNEEEAVNCVLLSVGINRADISISVRSVTDKDPCFNDWLLYGLISNIKDGEIEAIIVRKEI